MRRFVFSKELLLYEEIRNDNSANNGETFIIFVPLITLLAVVRTEEYNCLRTKNNEGNTVGSP